MRLVELITARFWRIIAKCLAPHLARTSVIFGDPRRVSIAKTAKVVNALINVQSGHVTIRDYAFFGHNVCLLTGSHDLSVDGDLRAQHVIMAGRDIDIGESAWVTSNVTIIGPSTIGRNSVVLPGSVVKGDVPANCIYGGVPAHKIRDL
jgi:acetyltransferase-like isoleucine patch superfamily enzyme